MKDESLFPGEPPTARGDKTAPLDGTIASYQDAIEGLSLLSADDAQSKVMNALIARDEVARVLANHSFVSPATLSRLIELDQQLKARATTIDTMVGRSTLMNWRETRQPPVGTWWWSLDERAAPKSSPFWTILSVFLVAATVGLTAEIARRFPSGGPGLEHISIPFAQALLTLLAGSTLTQVGHEWLEGFLYRRGVARKFHPALKTAIPLLAFGFAVALFLSLPAIARYYARDYINANAVALQQTGRLGQAIKSYERAISLYPDYAEAHYNLATAYEELGDNDKAVAEYQASLRADAGFYFAYNNLAHLYLLRGNDADKALQLLNTALNLKPPEPHVQYSLYKNRGWAHFILKNLTLAAEDLRKAIKLREEGAAAHCLLAQVLEAQKGPGAIEEWGYCEAYKTGQEHEVEASWLSLAQERLRKGGKK